MGTAHTTRSKRSKWTWIAIALLIALVVSGMALRWSGSRRLKLAIDRIALEGAALSPAFLTPASTPSKPDPAEWLARVARSRPQWDMSDVSDMQKYGFVLGEARANRLGEDARIAFESFDGHLRKHLEGANDELARWNEYWIALAARLRENDGVRPWGEMNEAGLRLLAVGLAEQVTLAGTASRYGEIDPLRAAAALDQSNSAFPTLPFIEEARIGDAIHVTAVHQALSKYSTTAVDTLRSGLAVARLHKSPRWLLSQIMWALQVSRVLDGLQTILPILPRGLDLSDLESELTDMRPRDALAAALRGERAFGHRAFEHVKEGSFLEGLQTLAPASWYARSRGFLVNDFDHAAYLESMTESAQRAEIAHHLRGSFQDGVESSFWTHIASGFAPRVEPSLRTTDMLEARLILARAALTAYRAGAKDTLEFISKTTDPFDGKPIRCGFGEDGLVVFWSVGPDGRDDGAAPGTDDIVWGLKLSD